MKSGIEIKQRLVHDTRHGRYPHHHLLPKFRAALGKAWFDLAWHHYQQQDRRKALDALRCSALTNFKIGTLKLLWRLIQPRLGAKTPNES